MSFDQVMIGSAAVNFHDPSILKRVPKDTDYLSLHLLKPAAVDGEVDLIRGEGILDKYEFKNEVASLDEIYTLKVSHSPWVIVSERNWFKHLKDISLLKNAGAVIVPDLYKIAYAEWEKRHGRKNVNLNKDKEEFFTSGVRRKYVHDSIHASVAFHDKPMFMRILADDSEVQTSRKKFENLTEQEKIELVSEEVFVLSLERELIPLSDKKKIDKTDLHKAYGKQLQLLITQYSKGYFPKWIIENFRLVHKPLLDYWEKFEKSDKKQLIDD